MAAAAGLLRNIIIGAEFGIGADLDAYYAAFKVPDLLFTIVAGGALATAFIPVFADFLAQDDRTDAWRLASAITNIVVLVVSTTAVIVGLLAPWLVRTVIAPGFSPAEQAETVQVMRIVLVSTVIFGISAVQGSVLHGFKHFLLPALGAALYPLGIAAGAVFLAPTMGVAGLAIGAVVGSLLHLLIKVPALIYYGFRWWPVLDLRTLAVRRVGVLMVPRILDLAVFQLTLVAMTNLASRLGPGGVSSVEWGWDAMQLPETIIGTAFGLVAFPTLAELAARGAQSQLRSTLGETLRSVIALTVPAAVGLILLGQPLLTLLYQRGAFTAAVHRRGLRHLALLCPRLSGPLLPRTGRARLFRATRHRDAVDRRGRLGGNQHPTGHPSDATARRGWPGSGQLRGHHRRGAGPDGYPAPPLAWRRRPPDPANVDPGRIGQPRDGWSGARLSVYAQQAGLSTLFVLVGGGLVGVVTYIIAGLLFGVREIRRLPAALFGR